MMTPEALELRHSDDAALVRAGECGGGVTAGVSPPHFRGCAVARKQQQRHTRGALCAAPMPTTPFGRACAQGQRWHAAPMRARSPPMAPPLRQPGPSRRRMHSDRILPFLSVNTRSKHGCMMEMMSAHGAWERHSLFLSRGHCRLHGMFRQLSSVPAASDLKKAEAARRDDRRRCVCGVVANAFV